MTIRAKLYAAIIVTVAGLALTVGVGIWAMDRLGNRFAAVERASDARALALQLKFGVTDFNGWQTAYGYDNGKSRPTFLSSVASFRGTLARARVELTHPQERRLLDAVEAAFNDFMRLDADAFAALQDGRKEEVRLILLDPEIANFRRAADAAQALAASEDARTSVEQRAFRDARRDALRFLIVAALVAGLLVVVLLVTANDLARAAERVLERAEAGDEDS